MSDTPADEFKVVKCCKCEQPHAMPMTFAGSVLCEGCDAFMDGEMRYAAGAIDEAFRQRDEYGEALTNCRTVAAAKFAAQYDRIRELETKLKSYEEGHSVELARTRAALTVSTEKWREAVRKLEAIETYLSDHDGIDMDDLLSTLSSYTSQRDAGPDSEFSIGTGEALPRGPHK